jgi:hypothetical protein
MINKSSRLATIDGLREGAVHHADRGWLDHRAEGFIIVDTGSL